MYRITSSQEYFNILSTIKDKPIVALFSAPWCGPCKNLKPIIETIEKELESKFQVLEINGEELQELTQEEGIRAFPTIIIYKNDKEVDRQVGMMSKQTFINLLKL